MERDGIQPVVTGNEEHRRSTRSPILGQIASQAFLDFPALEG